MSSEGAENWSELLISLETLLVVGREPLDDYDDTYVRSYVGPVKIQSEDGGDPKRIGEIEIWYLDGSRREQRARHRGRVRLDDLGNVRVRRGDLHRRVGRCLHC